MSDTSTHLLLPYRRPWWTRHSDQRSGVFTCWRDNAAGLGGWTFVTRISLTTLGRPYRSLSAIARAITGTRWNGLVFFGVKRQGTA